MQLRRSILAARQRSTGARHGSAPLELALSLPLLMWLAAVIVNAGAGGTAVCDATIAARTEAFRAAAARTSPVDQTFLFAGAATDVTSISAQRSAAVPPALGKSQLVGSAQLAVVRNAWDYREIKLNDPVSLDPIGRATVALGRGSAFALLNQAVDLGKSLGGDLSSIADLAQGLGELPASVQSIQNTINDLKQEAQKTIAEAQQKIDAAKKQVETIRENLKQTQAQIEQAKRDITDPDKLKERLKELDETTMQLNGDLKKEQDKQRAAELDKQAVEKANP